MSTLLRLGFLASIIGMAFVASLVVDTLGVPGVRARVAMAGDPVDIELHGGAGFEAITFGTECNSKLHPALICTDRLEIRNVGDYDFWYTIETWSDTNAHDDGAGGIAGDVYEPCINLNLQTPTADGLNVGDNTTHGPLFAGVLASGQSRTWGLEVSVDDDNDCQGRRATVFARVVAQGHAGEDGVPAPPSPPGSLTPLVPQTPLESMPLQTTPDGEPIPPSAGDGGLIGAHPAANGDRSWLVALVLGLALAGGICLYGAFALDARRQRS